MHNVFKRLYYIALLLACLSPCAKTCAANIITPEKAGAGNIALQLPYFEDQTGSNSIPQAEAQFTRLEKTVGLAGSSVLNLGNAGGTYWIDVVITNNTNFDKWVLDFIPASPDAALPIKTLSLYDPLSGNQNALAAWPMNGQKTQASLPLTIKPGETLNRYILVQAWPGMNVSLVPHIKTQQYALQQEIDTSQKTSLSWLILGVVFGAGLVQLILTRQSVQAVLALNALLVGIGIFIVQQPELLPVDTAGWHPILLPLIVACVCNLGACLMLWAASGWQNKKAAWCLLLILLNTALMGLAFFKLDMIFLMPFGVENLPGYVVAVNGAALTLLTFFIGLEKLSLYYYIPAWLLLAVTPFVGGVLPVPAPVLYVVLLGLAGVLSVFSHWNAMDKETENLQRRLRNELKSIKDKYREENENWNLKMENQRNILNELREREQLRSAELEQARKEADAANRAKSDFLAIISHEIRTPMNGIMGIVQIINETSLDDKQRDYIDVIKNSGETMLTLLNDILDYSKIEKGAIDLEEIPFSLRKLIQSVATLMSGRSLDKGLVINVKIAEELPDNLCGDPNRIRQILLNLISNAIKFTERGSVTLTVNATKDMTMFEVTDTGMGISSEAQKRLFQAYVQADSSISRRFGGTGLGLNICRMLVNAMQGKIGVNSIENEGSTFWFELPLKTSAAAHVPEVKKPVAPADKNDAKLHILVIDDNAVNLKVVRGLLEMDGHRVMIAENGESALRMVSQQDFDLVFVDMMMPGMNGKAFLEQLRQLPDKARAGLPVFALTGLADSQTKKDILQLGMLGIIVKPVSKEVLRDAVQQTLGLRDKQSGGYNIILAELEHLSSDEKGKLLQALTPYADENNILKTEIAMLNMTMLSELKSSLPASTLNEIFDELIEKAKDLTVEIEKANDDHDFKALGEKAHNIRGMAGNFGLQGLMEAFRRNRKRCALRRK